MSQDSEVIEPVNSSFTFFCLFAFSCLSCLLFFTLPSNAHWTMKNDWPLGWSPSPSQFDLVERNASFLSWFSGCDTGCRCVAVNVLFTECVQFYNLTWPAMPPCHNLFKYRNVRREMHHIIINLNTPEKNEREGNNFMHFPPLYCNTNFKYKSIR